MEDHAQTEYVGLHPESRIGLDLRSHVATGARGSKAGCVLRLRIRKGGGRAREARRGRRGGGRAGQRPSKQHGEAEVREFDGEPITLWVSGDGRFVLAVKAEKDVVEPGRGKEREKGKGR
jgi:hypothetical protein